MIYRIDVRSAGDTDPLGQSVRHQIEEFQIHVGPISVSRVFLIDTDAPRQQVLRAANELLADPLVERAALTEPSATDNAPSRIEIHLKPGVMDPVAASTEMALRDMGIPVREVRTGRAYLIDGKVPQEQLRQIANRVLANGVIESVHFDAFIPEKFETGREYRFQLRHVPLRDLSDEQLARLSREGHLFLSLAEMKAVQSYFREQSREPTDIELETLAQTWSEHCVHKTLKSAVDVEMRDAAGKVVGTRHYNNLIRETIFASTQELMKREVADPFCLSVFVDNAGVIAFDQTDAVCFKAETHNHPSAIEPYGGSATGAGGVIRDILGTGLAAKPIANTDVFCVAYPDDGTDAETRGRGDAEIIPGQSVPENSVSVSPRPRVPVSSLPRGVIHPKRILRQVVAGVRDYGNRMGIPTVNGAVYFDDRYLGNPLVFCGCVGLIPRDRIHKESRSGDAIVLMGGRTGRDGIHGATFSSAELTDTHADEFSHAVQIGNAITEKKMTDVVLQARDRGLFTAITDCGAGGLSSAVGEMGEKLGAFVELDKVPLKYAGLRYDEIWISEAQERMILSVPPENLDELLALSSSEDVEATVIGHFGTEDHRLILHYRGHEVGRLSMDFLHRGIPMPTRKAVVEIPRDTGSQPVRGASQNLKDQLLSLLSHPNIASKHWIIRQYDHEVQGGSVIKPLTGPLQIGPSDAAVLRPKLGSQRGIAIGCGLAPHIADPYQMALTAIDEAVRNVAAVGADPRRVALLDNFCWPSVDDERTMGTLVRACEACRDAALAYGIPFISGKDSLHNQFTNSETGQVIRIPNTLLVSAIGVIEDVRQCVTMDLKSPGNPLCLLSTTPDKENDLSALRAVHAAVAEGIRRGIILSCHDASDGGALVAAAEMAIASGLGLDLVFLDKQELDCWMAEPRATYLVELSPTALNPQHEQFNQWFGILRQHGVYQHAGGTVTSEPRLRVFDSPHQRQANQPILDATVEQLTTAWRGTLDW
ncbi:MAG TPA: phosphoribosylformylglycinamidine synthase subunit PurS [Tepidisphaeraceae bacterium]|nr:phosphoribosylformylglycinamidine synthase subunit PurS [Tepidisphaeraceae bacterium]